jgi:multiple sugar transport system permease protein
MTNKSNWTAQGGVVVLAVLFSAPLVLLAISSVKPAEQLRSDPYRFWPQRWAFENYASVLRETPFRRQLRNTLLLCGGSVLGSVASCSLAAYGFSRIRWRASKPIFGLLVATMLLPWQVTMVPRFLLLREAGLHDTLAALILPTFLGDAFYIFLLRQFLLTIPEELSEAARLDGLSEWGIYRHIVLPLSLPALGAVAVFQFVASWNDFGGPMLYLSDPEKFPLAYGLEQFVSSYADQTHLLLAATVLFALPVVILVLCFQRLLGQGISTTGLKG